ncbi:MAG: hypothetical protein ACLS7Z_11250 [Christensenellales bacterium]
MKGDNTRLPGKMQLHERLKFDEEGRPMLYVFENCRDFRRTIPALVYDARKPEDIDTAGEDHIYDETRYFLCQGRLREGPRLLPSASLTTRSTSSEFATGGDAGTSL